MRLRSIGHCVAALLCVAVVAAPWLPAADDTKPGPLLLKGHRENVFGIAFSPDGKLVVTASGDPSVKVWDAVSGKELKGYQGGRDAHRQLVLSVAISPDGSQFATGGGDNSAKLWDMPTSQHMKSIPLASNSSAVAVSLDGKTIASGGADGKVSLHTSEGKLLRDLPGAAGPVRSLGFSRDGQRVAALSSDGVLRAWNVADGKAFARFAAHVGEGSLGFSPNQNILYTAGADGQLKYWTVPFVAPKPLPTGGAMARSMSIASDNTVLALAAGKAVHLASLSNGETRGTFAADVELTCAAVGSGTVAAGTASREVILWKLKENKIAARLPAHDGAVTGVAISNGNLLATSGKDGAVRLWTLPIAPTRSVTSPANVTAAQVLADGKRLAVAGADKVIRLYKLDGGLERQLSGHKGAVRVVAVSQDGKTVASAGDSGNVRIWSSKGDTSAVLGAHEGAVVSLVYVGTRVLSASADGSVKLWQPASGEGKLSHAGSVLAAAVSPDGSRLVTACDDKQVRTWNLANNKSDRTYAGPTMAVTSVGWSRGGDRLVAGSSDKSAWVWDRATGKVIRKLTGLPAAVQAVGLPADGKSVLAGLADGSTRLHDLTTGKETRSFAGPKAAVSCLALTTRGDLVLIGHADGTVSAQPLTGAAPRTWKAAGPVTSLAVRPDATAVAVGTGKTAQLFALDGKALGTVTTPAEVRGLAYSADSKRLAVAGADGKARTYDAAGRLEEFFAHEGAVNDVAFTTDGKRLVSASADKTARVRPLSLVWQARPGAAVTQAVAGSRGMVVSAIDGTVHVFNPNDGKSVQAFLAHAGAATDISVANDGAKVATIGADGMARVFDLAKPPVGKPAGKEVAPSILSIKLSAPGAGVSLSPNGKRLAVSVPATKGHAVRIHDATTGQHLATMGNDEPASMLAWQPDNRTLLTAGAGKQVRLIDVAVAAAFDAHAGGVAGIAFSPNNADLVSAGADKAARLWAVSTGKLTRTFGPLPEAPTGVAFSRDGSQVAFAAGKKAHLFTTADGKPLMELESPAVLRDVAYNSDKTRLMAGGADGRARVYDLVAKREVMAFLHEGAITGVAWNPSAPTQAFTAGEDKQAYLHVSHLARTADSKTPLRTMAVSGNGTFVIAGGDDGRARRFNASNGTMEKEFPGSGKALSAVAVSKNEQLVATAGADGKLRVFVISDGKLLAAVPLAGPVRDLAFSPDNRALVVVPAAGAMTAIDTQYPGAGQPLPESFGKVVQTNSHPGGATGVAFPRDGSIFWTSGGDKSVKAWKLASDSPTRSFSHPGSVSSVAYDKEGKYLITACSDGRLRIFDLVKGSQLKQVDAHMVKDKTAIYGLAVSADGKLAATASIDESAKVWSIPDGRLVKEIKPFKDKVSPQGHKDAVLSVAFSPDGKQLATGSMDQTVKVWNLADGKLVREMANPAIKGFSHPGWVYALRWTKDGKHLVSAGAAPRLKGYFAVWEAATGKLEAGQETEGGTIFALALSPDEKLAGLGRGGSIRPDSDVHTGTILKIPGR